MSCVVESNMIFRQIHHDIKAISGLLDEQKENIQRLTHLDAFKNLPKKFLVSSSVKIFIIGYVFWFK